MRMLLMLNLFLFISSCTTERSTPPYVVLSGEVDGLRDDSLNLKTDARFRYYEQAEVMHSIPVQANGRFKDTLFLEEGHYQLQAGNEKVSLFLKPGYNLQLQLSEGDLSFKGPGTAECNYLKARDSLISQVGGKNYYQYYSNLQEDDFLRSAEFQEKQRLALLKVHRKIDPQLFKSETLWAKVEKAHKIHNYSFTRETVDTSYMPSSTYPGPFTHLDLNDEDLLNVSLLPILMYSEFGQTAQEQKMEVWEYVFKEEFPVNNPIIKEEALFAIAKFAMHRFKKLDEFYARFEEIVKNEEYKKEITALYLDLKQLKPGSQAPAFELKNMEGELTALQDFQGNLIYLDFWATWCKPCIEDLPEFKELQEKFQAEEIKFVSIGMESKKKTLMKLIKDHQLKNVHLFDPEQEHDLKKNYSISGIPRYVLIDRKGKIIDHNAKRPSNPELVTQLQNLLN